MVLSDETLTWRGGAIVAFIHRARTLPDLILRWQDRTAQRRQLAGMSDRLLKDIGVSNADAAREAAKPFWRG